jgi:acyl carrier protein
MAVRSDRRRSATVAQQGGVVADQVTPVRVVELVRSLVRPASGPIDTDTPLLSTGIIDSFAVAELLEAFATELGIEVPIEELGVDNADTPLAMAALLNRHRG